MAEVIGGTFDWDENASVCHECGEWRRECTCDPKCEQQDKPLWPDMAESDYDA